MTLAEQLAKLGLVDKAKAEKVDEEAKTRWATGPADESPKYKPEEAEVRRAQAQQAPVVTCAPQPAQRRARETAEREALEATAYKYIAAMEGGDVYTEFLPSSQVIEVAVLRVGAIKALHYMIRLNADRGDTNSGRTAHSISFVLVTGKTVPTQEEVEMLTDEQLNGAWVDNNLFPWAKVEIIRRYRPEQGFITPVYRWSFVTSEGTMENLPGISAYPEWVKHGQQISVKPSPNGWYDGKQFHHGDKFSLFTAVAGNRPQGLYLHFLKSAGSFEGTRCWGRHPQQGYARFWWSSKGGPHITLGVQGKKLEDDVDRLIEACKGDMKLPNEAFWVSGEVRGNQLVASHQPKVRGAILLVKGYWTRTHLKTKGEEYVLFNPIKGSEQGGARVLGHTSGHTTGAAHHWTYTVVYLPEGGSLKLDAVDRHAATTEVREVSFDFTTGEPVWKKA